LEDGPAFSFSDTLNDSILAITEDYGTIGIDMEIERQCSYFPFIARHYFANEERQYCMEESNDSIDLRRFFEIWVKKEAIIKSKGGSIYDNLRAFNAFSPYYVERFIYKEIDFSQI